jgi:hypothetical protein
MLPAPWLLPMRFREHVKTGRVATAPQTTLASQPILPLLSNSLYLSAVETLLKVVLRLVPSAKTVAMIAMEMPAAINPYSIAVAPDRLFQNRTRTLRKSGLRLLVADLSGIPASTLRLGKTTGAHLLQTKAAHLLLIETFTPLMQRNTAKRLGNK